MKHLFFTTLFFVSLLTNIAAQRPLKFRVLGFYTAKNDQAHISFVHEANRWLAKTANENKFQYDSTNNWSLLNDSVLAQYQVVLFLDTRPEDTAQRSAFRRYMERGGSWIGFHFAGFALSPSGYPQNWDWYHNEFLGSGMYKGNTWRPTSAILRVENKNHPAMKHLPKTFKSAPNEWYSWEKDLRMNKDIKILLSIDSTSFPLGTGPKQWEIWHSGYYPVAWTNTRYRMLYINMGHNDIDYEHGTNRELSFQFDNKVQCRMLVDALKWLGKSSY